ncbi:MAG: 2-amino-4-hydroxy-6-hydroxymethyldihydropteridine diphosphokinase, partial [Mycobacteriales bacterium]
NVGDRLEFLRSAVATLGERLTVRATSPVYETAPVGGPVQPRYLNAVLLVDPVPAEELLAAARAAERRAGRARGVRHGPRTLDVDVIAVPGVVRADPELTLPHPRAHERAFVLAPWCDVEPAAVLAGRGPVADLLAALGPAGVVHRPDLVLE